jgi:hypothetical protein
MRHQIILQYQIRSVQIMEGQYAFDAFAAQQNSYLMQAGMQGGMQGGMQRGMQYEDPLGGIDYPGLNDVMCGRGMFMAVYGNDFRLSMS